MSGEDHSVIVTLLIMLLITAVVVGIAMAGFVSALNKRRRVLHVISLNETDEDEIVMPFLFDRPSKWLAIKSSNLPLIQSALNLHNPTPCTWSDGFSKAAESKLFICPPVQGWVLVFGHALPDPADDIDKFYLFMTKLGRELVSIQFFQADRVFHHHAWIMIENGQVSRAYAWADETLWNQGSFTPAEKALELKCSEYGEPPLPFPFSTRDSNVANCEKVMQLAARWSIDPTTLNSRNLKRTLGIAGDSHRFRPR